MIEFGRTLREAREAKGYSVSQIAEMTRLMHQVVEDLEVENFSRIPAPIYGRGFVKLYCEAVGIDPKPLIDEYMAIQAGNRPATIRVRRVEPPAAAPAEPEGAPGAPSAPAAVRAPGAPTPAPRDLPSDEIPLFAREPLRPVPSTPAAVPAAEPAPATRPAFITQEHRAAAAEPLLPHRQREFKMPEMNLPPLPRHVWRIALVLLAAALLLWGLVAGFRALYRATMTPPAAPAPTTAPAAKPQGGETAPAADGKTPAAETPAARTPQDIPPLYID